MVTRDRCFALMLGVAVLWFGHSAALAGPVLELEFLNSGQTFGATDYVPVHMRLTNVGDMALVDSFGMGGTYITPTAIFNQYWDQFPSTLSVSPTGGGLLTLNPGESVTWRFVEFEPYPYIPVPGNIGDPVLDGVYVLGPSAFTNPIMQYLDPSFNLVNVPVSVVNSFTWTVGSVTQPPTGVVPTPAAAGAGLVLLGVMVWRRRGRGR